MHILLLGLDHRSTTVEVRERASMPPHTQPARLASLLARPAVLEAVILSTCNRTEIYAMVESVASGQDALSQFFCSETSLGLDHLQQHGEFLEDGCAIDHLYRVAAGLESLVLGEGQILHQVKEAHAMALEQGAAGKVLDRMFRSALTAGKRARSETEIARGAVSVSSAAVELARDVLGDLTGRSILLLGSGKMSELAARLLSGYGVTRIQVANRTRESADELANRIGGETVPWIDLVAAMLDTDVVICATGAPHFVVQASDLNDRIGRRAARPLVLIDISVPRNLDPALGALPGIRLFDIDDLHAVTQRNHEVRASVVDEVVTILNHERADFDSWLKNLRLTPMITSLRTQIEALRDTELDRFWGKHTEHFDPTQRELVEDLAQALINKILHQPTTELKRMTPPQQERHASALTALFGLTVEDAADQYRRAIGERRRRVGLSNP